MYMAIAVEPAKNPMNRADYKIWYLHIDNVTQDVIGIGSKTREELVQSLFTQYKKTGQSNWRVFKKNSDCSTPIEIFDFIAQNMHENTHFGELPTLSEFHETLQYLQMNFEIHAIAS